MLFYMCEFMRMCEYDGCNVSHWWESTQGMHVHNYRIAVAINANACTLPFSKFARNASLLLRKPPRSVKHQRGYVSDALRLLAPIFASVLVQLGFITKRGVRIQRIKGV